MLGIGLAATRDLNAFFRYEKQDAAGTPNPVAGKITACDLRRQLAVGHVPATVAAARLQPGRARAHRVGRDESAHRRAIHRSQSALRVSRRPRVASTSSGTKGRPGGALERHGAQASGRKPARSLPRDQHLPEDHGDIRSGRDLGTAASFMLVGTTAKADIPLPDNVRRYYFPGVTHGGGPGGFATIHQRREAAATCELPTNPAPVAPMRAALMKALVAWVTDGTPMPASRYPTIADGTLVPNTDAAMGFPAIPGQAVARRDSVPAARLRPRSAFPIPRPVRRRREDSRSRRARCRSSSSASTPTATKSPA